MKIEKIIEKTKLFLYKSGKNAKKISVIEKKGK